MAQTKVVTTHRQDATPALRQAPPAPHPAAHAPLTSAVQSAPGKAPAQQPTPPQSEGEKVVAGQQQVSPPPPPPPPLLPWRVSLGSHGPTTPDPRRPADDLRGQPILAATADEAWAKYAALHGIVASDHDADIVQL